jgi:hypothetical protein
MFATVYKSQHNLPLRNSRRRGLGAHSSSEILIFFNMLASAVVHHAGEHLRTIPQGIIDQCFDFVCVIESITQGP